MSVKELTDTLERIKRKIQENKQRCESQSGMMRGIEEDIQKAREVLNNYNEKMKKEMASLGVSLSPQERDASLKKIQRALETEKTFRDCLYNLKAREIWLNTFLSANDSEVLEDASGQSFSNMQEITMRNMVKLAGKAEKSSENINSMLENAKSYLEKVRESCGEAAYLEAREAFCAQFPSPPPIILSQSSAPSLNPGSSSSSSTEPGQVRGEKSVKKK